MRRRDVQDDDLVDPLDVVPRGELRGIAGAPEALEVHALDDRPVTDVEAGDDALRQVRSTCESGLTSSSQV